MENFFNLPPQVMPLWGLMGDIATAMQNAHHAEFEEPTRRPVAGGKSGRHVDDSAAADTELVQTFLRDHGLPIAGVDDDHTLEYPPNVVEMIKSHLERSESDEDGDSDPDSIPDAGPICEFLINTGVLSNLPDDGIGKIPEGIMKMIKSDGKRKQSAPAAKSGPTRKNEPVKKSEPAAKSGPTRKNEPVKKSEPAAKSGPTRKNEPVKKSEPAVKSGPTRKNEPVKKSEPAAKSGPTRKNEPVKKSEPAVKSGPTRKNEPSAQSPPAKQNMPAQKFDPTKKSGEDTNNHSPLDELGLGDQRPSKRCIRTLNSWCPMDWSLYRVPKEHRLSDTMWSPWDTIIYKIHVAATLYLENGDCKLARSLTVESCMLLLPHSRCPLVAKFLVPLRHIVNATWRRLHGGTRDSRPFLEWESDPHWTTAVQDAIQVDQDPRLNQLQCTAVYIIRSQHSQSLFESEFFARAAVNNDPSEGMCWAVLGMVMRTARYAESTSESDDAVPFPMEVLAWERAYEMRKTPVICFNLARTLLEADGGKATMSVINRIESLANEALTAFPDAPGMAAAWKRLVLEHTEYAVDDRPAKEKIKSTRDKLRRQRGKK